MKKRVLSLALLTTVVSTAALADAGPGCGPGAILWRGKNGLVAHTSAGTTNGTFSSPFSAILSGTSECDPSGMVQNEYQKNIFVAMNMDMLASEAAQGQGDHLASLAQLYGIADADRGAFYQLTQSNFSNIFGTPAGSRDVIAAVDGMLIADGSLNKYVK